MMMNFYKRLRLIVSLLFVLISASLFAQESKVSGTITDESGAPVPGVTIVEKGTANGATSDNNGQYSLNVGANATLVFSFIGFKTQEITVGNQTSVNVSLQPDVTALEEVVVTGYTVDKRRDLTGAISTVKPKDITYAPSGNVEQMLQGRVPGVTVITNGQPGTTSQIRVRGFGGFGANSPLYVVDGVPTQDVGFLNPDDIESIAVLKDAAAASIYGARAASGVIVYTTKRGKSSSKKLNVTYDALYGTTTPGKGQSMMNPQDFADWTWNAIKHTEDANAAAAGTSPNYAAAISAFNHPQFGTGATPKIPDYINVGGLPGISGTVDLAAEKLLYNIDPRVGGIHQVVAANKSGTDWYKEITRNAPIYRQTLGFSGAGDSHRFYLGFSMQDQKGILLSNSYKRYTFRANTEFDVLKNVRIGENLQFTYLQRRGLTGAQGGQGIAADENDILSAFRMPSIIPVYDVFGGYAGTQAKGFNNPRNPVANQHGFDNDRNFNAQAFGNVYAEWDVIPGLTLRTTVGGQYQSYFYKSYSRWQYENSENNSAFGFSQGNGYSFGWNVTNTARYVKTIAGGHAIDLLAGQEALNTGYGWDYSMGGLNPFSWNPNYINMGNVSSKTVNSAQYNGVTFSSYFGRIGYTFKDKYIISGVVRRDGSSRFGPSTRYGVFPAVSVAWRVTSENFMKSVPFIQDLKIRGGYGTMGNSNNVNPNNQFSLYGGSLGNSSYDITGANTSAQTGFYRTAVGNPKAKWETSVTSNIGFDGLFFDGKLDVVVDFWKKETKDLLLPLALPSTAGYGATAPSVNVARMVNKGIDLMIGTKGNLTQDLKYEVTVNGSFLNNQITAIAPGLTYLTNINPNYRGIAPIRNQLGQSISSFYGYVVDGLYKDAAEVTGSATQAGAAPGRFKYRDLNGDGKIDDKDRTYLGSPVPKFTGGINFTLRYMGFDMSVYGYTSLGNKIFNVSKWFTDFYPSFQGAAISNRIKDSWTSTNTGATIPVFESASNFSTNTQASSFYVENGSYFRLQNITLGYTLPSAMLTRVKMSKLRFYVTANNLFTITKYQGLDPAVGGAADTNFGIDIGNYPVTRQYTVGLNLGF